MFSINFLIFPIFLSLKSGSDFLFFPDSLPLKWKNVSTFQLVELAGFHGFFELIEYRVLRDS